MGRVLICPKAVILHLAHIRSIQRIVYQCVDDVRHAPFQRACSSLLKLGSVSSTPFSRSSTPLMLIICNANYANEIYKWAINLKPNHWPQSSSFVPSLQHPPSRQAIINTEKMKKPVLPTAIQCRGDCLHCLYLQVEIPPLLLYIFHLYLLIFLDISY